MKNPARKLSTNGKAWIAALAVLLAAGGATISTAGADEAQARSLLKAMSDYLAT